MERRTALDQRHQDHVRTASGLSNSSTCLRLPTPGRHCSRVPRSRRVCWRRLFSGSQALSNLLAARPEWLGALEPEALKFPRRKQGLRNEVNRWLKPAAGGLGVRRWR